MSTVKLTDKQWDKILKFLRADANVYVGDERICRRFVEGVKWATRSGAQWRLLPASYGKWNSVYKRYARWCDNGVWERLHADFADDPDMESILVDSTIVRAHPCAAGAAKKKGGQQAQGLGRSRGGFSSKIHLLVDALGNPLRFMITAGQVNDITQGEALIAGYQAQHVVGDKAYDADAFIAAIEHTGASAVIPSKANRTQPRAYDQHLYRERHLVECFINKIKHYRRIFSRFDKLSKRYLGFLQFAAALIWMR